MKTKPILFNEKMVKAILRGEKTVTRRLIKPRYREDEGGFQVCHNEDWSIWYVEKMDWDGGGFDDTRYVKPPFLPGDILYVRETWNYGYFDSADSYGSNACWFEEFHKHDGKYLKAISRYIYRADYTEKEQYQFGTEDDKGNLIRMPWKPSLHMPKEAARIWLEVKKVTVQRIQEMTENDAYKEGVRKDGRGNLEAFQKVWQSTVSKRDAEKYGWQADPWVWVIEFEKCDDPNR